MPLAEYMFWKFVARQVVFFLLHCLLCPSLSSFLPPFLSLFPPNFLFKLASPTVQATFFLKKYTFSSEFLIKISLMCPAACPASQALRHVADHLTSHSALSFFWPLRVFCLNWFYWCHLSLVFFVNTEVHSSACFQGGRPPTQMPKVSLEAPWPLASKGF